MGTLRSITSCVIGMVGIGRVITQKRSGQKEKLAKPGKVLHHFAPFIKVVIFYLTKYNENFVSAMDHSDAGF